MKKIFSIIETQFDKKVSAKGLGLFRIAYGLVLFMEVFELFRFKELIFDEVPFLIPYEVDFKYLLLFWCFSIVCIIIGYKTRFFAILNYLFTLFIMGTMYHFEYHVFYAYSGLNLLLPFMGVHRALSVDAALDSELKKDVSILNYHIPVFIGIALVYFDSIFHKFGAGFWMKGLGMWLPSALPQMTHFHGNPILESLYLTKFLGYTTLVFETVFIFLFWFRKFKIPFFIIGLSQ